MYCNKVLRYNVAEPVYSLIDNNFFITAYITLNFNTILCRTFRENDLAVLMPDSGQYKELHRKTYCRSNVRAELRKD